MNADNPIDLDAPYPSELRAFFELKLLKTNDQLPKCPSEAAAHYEALRSNLADQAASSVLNHLYTALSILDSKAQTLLGYNAIVLAMLFFFMEADTRYLPLVRNIVVVFGAMCGFTSCGILVRVVWVRWTTTGELKSSDTLGKYLLDVRRRRTIWYRAGWYFAAMSIVWMGLAFLIVAFDRTVSALGGVTAVAPTLACTVREAQSSGSDVKCEIVGLPLVKAAWGR